jgi:2-polyprenyl-6-methoxyphenol hydroxylase-like FAD-dependent oxidoreductase
MSVKSGVDRGVDGTHTIVAGGGLSGLAAATYLARGGESVTVLEKSSALGGRAITDTPRGYVMNRGAHALYTGGAASSVLEPGAPTRRGQADCGARSDQRIRLRNRVATLVIYRK